MWGKDGYLVVRGGHASAGEREDDVCRGCVLFSVILQSATGVSWYCFCQLGLLACWLQ